MTKENKEHKPKTHKSAKRILDVVPPGKAIPLPRSRPVITGHKPAVADDQFVAKTAGEGGKRMAADPFEKHELMDAKKKISLTPTAPEVAQSPQATPPAATTAPTTTAPVTTTQSSVTPTASTTPEVTAPPSKQEAPTSTATPVTIAAPATTQTVPVTVAGPASAPNTKPTESQPVAVQTPTSAPGGDKTAALQQLAVEQVVAEPGQPAVGTPTSTPAHSPAEPTDRPAEHATNWKLPEEEKHAPIQAHHSAKTIDELLAETGAPNLEPDQAPPKQLIVSHHSGGHTGLKWLIGIVIFLVFAAVAVDVLIDANVITTDLNIPHTDFIN